MRIGHHYSIATSIARAIFCAHVKSHEHKRQINDIVIVELAIGHLIIRKVGKKCLKAIHECLHVSTFNFPNKSLYIERRISIIIFNVIGHKAAQKTLLYFTIGISKSVFIEIHIISLDGEISALKKQRQRIHHRQIYILKFCACLHAFLESV